MVEWLKQVVALVQEMLVAGLDALVRFGDWVKDRVQRSKVSVRMTEGTAICRKCDWELTGPPRALQVAYAMHLRERHR